MKIHSVFTARVFEVVLSIPYGHVTTYGAVAAMAFSPRAARAVGQALRSAQWEPDAIPWHRVINAKGGISFRGDIARATLQRQRLVEEGVLFDARGLIDLTRFAWWGD